MRHPKQALTASWAGNGFQSDMLRSAGVRPRAKPGCCRCCRRSRAPTLRCRTARALSMLSVGCCVLVVLRRWWASGSLVADCACVCVWVWWRGSAGAQAQSPTPREPRETRENRGHREHTRGCKGHGRRSGWWRCAWCRFPTAAANQCHNQCHRHRHRQTQAQAHGQRQRQRQ
jgi:hypothetical protein